MKIKFRIVRADNALLIEHDGKFIYQKATQNNPPFSESVEMDLREGCTSFRFLGMNTGGPYDIRVKVSIIDDDGNEGASHQLLDHISASSPALCVDETWGIFKIDGSVTAMVTKDSLNQYGSDGRRIPL